MTLLHNRLTFCGVIGRLPLMVFDTPAGALWIMPEQSAMNQLLESRDTYLLN